MAISVRLKLEFRNRTGLELWIVEKDGKPVLWIDVQTDPGPECSTWSSRSASGEPVQGTFTADGWDKDPDARKTLLRDVVRKVLAPDANVDFVGL